MAATDAVTAQPAHRTCARRRSGRSRGSPALLLACFLALATGVVLLCLGDLLAPRTPGAIQSDPDSDANVAVVRQFYAAVDGVLAGGDPASLDSILAPGFVDHAAAPGASPDRAGLARELVALGALFPDLRLVATDVVAQGDEVVARVVVEQAAPAAFVGIPLPIGWTIWGSIEVFRVAGGRIAERWAGDAPATLLEPYPTASIDLPADSALVVTRIAVAPNGVGTASGTVGPTLLWVVSGSPTVTLDALYAPRAEVTGGAGQLDAGTPAAIAPKATVTVAPGDLVRIEDASYTLRNPGAAPAVLVAVASEADVQQATLFRDTQGVVTQVLADASGAALQVGQSVVAFGRATLAGGVGLPTHRVAGTEVVAVEAGTAALTINDGTTVIQRGTGATTVSTDGMTAETTTLGQGDVGLVEEGGGAEVRNAGESPLTLVVVAVVVGPPRTGPHSGTPASGGS